MFRDFKLSRRWGRKRVWGEGALCAGTVSKMNGPELL